MKNAVTALLAAVALAACGEPTTAATPPPQDARSADVVPSGCTTCGAELCCGENLTCEPVDFVPRCVCGAELACKADQVCFPWEDGVTRCTTLLPAGGGDCTTLPRRCVEGASCWLHDPHASPSTYCHTACAPSRVFCDDGSFCIALGEPGDHGEEAICNAGGTSGIGVSCSSPFHCAPELFCVDGRCTIPCRLSAPKCPGGQSCATLEGGGHVGACI